MSDNYGYVYEVWADLFFEALRSNNPRERIISLLLEFEGGTYNRALNDVLKSIEKHGDNSKEAQFVQNLLLDTGAQPEKQEEQKTKADVIPFPLD